MCAAPPRVLFPGRGRAQPVQKILGHLERQLHGAPQPRLDTHKQNKARRHETTSPRPFGPIERDQAFGSVGASGQGGVPRRRTACGRQAAPCSHLAAHTVGSPPPPPPPPPPPLAGPARLPLCHRAASRGRAGHHPQRRRQAPRHWAAATAAARRPPRQEKKGDRAHDSAVFSRVPEGGRGGAQGRP